MTKKTARRKRSLVAKPFHTIHIHKDGTYNRAVLLNDGTIHFTVDFPPGSNICEIALDINFTTSLPLAKASLSLAKGIPVVMAKGGGGGTIVIGTG